MKIGDVEIDLGPLPKIHAREMVTQKAELDLHEAIDKVRREHQLTLTELLQALHGYILSLLKYALRRERHPKNPDKPAGVE